jgi:hypothetical protein
MQNRKLIIKSTAKTVKVSLLVLFIYLFFEKHATWNPFNERSFFFF